MLLRIFQFCSRKDSPPSRIAQNSLQSTLLRLPAELRNKIWEFAFGDQTLRVHRATCPLRTRLTTCLTSNTGYFYYVPQLVSRQYWTETFDVLLKSCALSFDDARVFESFTSDLKPTVAQIRRIKITVYAGRGFPNSTENWNYAILRQCASPIKSLEGLHMELHVLYDEELADAGNIMARDKEWEDFRDIVQFFQQIKLKEGLMCVYVEDYSGSKHDKQELSDVICKHLLDFQARAEIAGSQT